MCCLRHYDFRWHVLLLFLVPIHLLHAQSPACQEKPPAEIDFSRDVKVTILSVEFPRELPLSETIRTKVDKEVRGQDITTDPEAPDSEWWVENYVDWRIREELRCEGYFKANVHSRPYLVLAKTDELQYIVAVEAEPGPQYRLRELEFKNVSAVKPDELRKMFPLHSGDIFDVSKFRGGIEAIGELYGQLGYIDATPGPETHVDEQSHVIDLVVNIDEQQQYRVDKFEVLGLDSQTAKSLESLIGPGQTFNKASLEALFKERKSVLPVNSSLERNAVITRNTKDATVSILLDFRSCPEPNANQFLNIVQ